ncbi:hypothetical protein VKT23_010914 [Stygiomarasmius scandens]|uniref:Uncharacterized protein n=1 Tax=Marasmiellus scandens TaxID=2682957 RepID=A0ABR1JAK6_9AGAR
MGGGDLDQTALGALVGLPPIGPPPDSPTKESGTFGTSHGFGFGPGRALWRSRVTYEKDY